MAKPENERERIALEPCPFCGSEAIRCQNHEGRLPEAMIWIMCKACHASPGDFPTDERAIAAWNRRAPLPQQGEAVTSGWVMVPREPTEAMTRAWWRSHFSDDPVPGGRTDRDAYAAMLAAAPRAALAEPVAWLVTNGADSFVTMMRTDAETWRRNGATIVPLGPLGSPAPQALAEPVAWTIADQEELAALIIRVVGLDDDPMRALQIKTPMARRAWDVSAQILGRTPSADPDACNYPDCGCDVDEVCNAGIDKIEVAPAEAQARIEALESELRVALSAYDGIIDLGGKLDLLGSNLEMVESAHARVSALLSGSTPKPAGMEITEEMVERACRGFCISKGWNPDDEGGDRWRDIADDVRAALTAALSGGSDAKAD